MLPCARFPFSNLNYSDARCLLLGTQTTGVYHVFISYRKSVHNVTFFYLKEWIGAHSSFSIWRRFLLILKICIMGRSLWKTTHILIFWDVIWWTKNMFWNSGSLIFVITMCQEIVKAVICKRSCGYQIVCGQKKHMVCAHITHNIYLILSFFFTSVHLQLFYRHFIYNYYWVCI